MGKSTKCEHYVCVVLAWVGRGAHKDLDRCPAVVGAAASSTSWTGGLEAPVACRACSWRVWRRQRRRRSSWAGE